MCAICRSVRSGVREVLRSDAGATAIEYSIIAGMIAFVIIAAVALVGGDLAAIFQGLADQL